ncbi:MAG: WD40 repeat domain-containing protein [Anaerolineales bacterium]
MWDILAPDAQSRIFETEEQLIDVAVQPGGNLLVASTASAGLVVWDIETGDIVTRLSGHSGQVNSVAFNADGTRLLSGSTDRTVLVWDMTSFSVLQTLEGHTDWVMDVLFVQPDLGLTASFDSEVLLWRMQSREQLIAWVCQNRYVRALETQEAARFGLFRDTYADICTLPDAAAR